MIGDGKGKLLTNFVYYNKDGEEVVLNALYKALQDGTLRLVWKGQAFYLEVTPTEIVWVTQDTTSELTVQSNTSWWTE